jgi:hypothetical protein
MIKRFWTIIVITVIVFLVFTTIMASTTPPIFQPIEKYQLTEYQQQIEQFIGHIKGIPIPVSGNRFPIYINPSTNSWRYIIRYYCGGRIIKQKILQILIKQNR